MASRLGRRLPRKLKHMAEIAPGARTIANPRRPSRGRRIARRPACPDDLAASGSGPDGPRRPRSRCRTQTTQSTSAGTSTHVSRTTRSRLDQGPSDHRMLPGSVYGLFQMRLSAFGRAIPLSPSPLHPAHPAREGTMQILDAGRVVFGLPSPQYAALVQRRDVATCQSTRSTRICSARVE
jgi:hypothetical protein